MGTQKYYGIVMQINTIKYYDFVIYINTQKYYDRPLKLVGYTKILRHCYQ